MFSEQLLRLTKSCVLDENLCGIKAQLENNDLVRITEMLKANQSAHIERFGDVISNIEVSS